MARTLAALPEGSRITDYISLGVITKTFPLKRVRAVLAATGKASQRERDLPAHVVVYYVIVLALYMRSSYREVLRGLHGSRLTGSRLLEVLRGVQLGTICLHTVQGMKLELERISVPRPEEAEVLHSLRIALPRPRQRLERVDLRLAEGPGLFDTMHDCSD